MKKKCIMIKDMNVNEEDEYGWKNISTNEGDQIKNVDKGDEERKCW